MRDIARAACPWLCLCYHTEPCQVPAIKEKDGQCVRPTTMLVGTPSRLGVSYSRVRQMHTSPSADGPRAPRAEEHT